MQMLKTFLPAAALILMAGTAPADVPQVATDIAPVHGLAARVMLSIGEPHLVVPPGASPHGHSMRPSEARALSNADAVFWIGEALTPWLEGPIENLSGQAHVVELLGAGSTLALEFREAAIFGADGHYDHHEEHGDHEDGHEDHEDHDDHDDDDDRDAGTASPRVVGIDIVDDDDDSSDEGPPPAPPSRTKPPAPPPATATPASRSTVTDRIEELQRLKQAAVLEEDFMLAKQYVRT